jgi:hypothetical protein
LKGGYLAERSGVAAGTMTTLTAFLGHRNSNRGELACQRKLTPRRRNITKTPRRAIGLLPNITAKANTPRVRKNRRKRRATQRPPASIPRWRTARANRRSEAYWRGRGSASPASAIHTSRRRMTDRASSASNVSRPPDPTLGGLLQRRNALNAGQREDQRKERRVVTRFRSLAPRLAIIMHAMLQDGTEFASASAIHETGGQIPSKRRRRPGRAQTMARIRLQGAKSQPRPCGATSLRQRDGISTYSRRKTDRRGVRNYDNGRGRRRSRKFFRRATR